MPWRGRLVNSAGTNPPRLLCGRTVLWSMHPCLDHPPGLSDGRNRCSLRHSSRKRPLKLSSNLFCCGCPGRCNATDGGSHLTQSACRADRCWRTEICWPKPAAAFRHRTLSLTTPSMAARDARLSSRTTRRPDSEVSMMHAKHFPAVVVDHVQHSEPAAAGQ